MDTFTLTADKAVGAHLVRAHQRGRTLGYAIADTFGWAIIAPVRVNRHAARWTTVRRVDQVDAAVRALCRYVTNPDG
jgi:hypothetical protein